VLIFLVLESFQLRFEIADYERMNNMKLNSKAIAMLVVGFVLVFALTACGGGDSDDPTPTPALQESQSSSEELATPEPEAEETEPYPPPRPGLPTPRTEPYPSPGEGTDTGSNGSGLSAPRAGMEATDPSTVELAAGRPTLVEFFAYW
jgi:hypothetical protein